MGNRPERAEFQSLILRATGRLWEIGSARSVASELCFTWPLHEDINEMG